MGDLQRNIKFILVHLYMLLLQRPEPSTGTLKSWTVPPHPGL